MRQSDPSVWNDLVTMQTPGPDDPANKTCPVCPRNKPSLELSKAVVSDELALNYEMFGNSALVSHPSDSRQMLHNGIMENTGAFRKMRLFEKTKKQFSLVNNFYLFLTLAFYRPYRNKWFKHWNQFPSLHLPPLAEPLIRQKKKGVAVIEN